MTQPAPDPNLDTPMTGEIPDVSGIVPPDGGNGPSTEEQILDDADLTDIPDAETVHAIPDTDATVD